MELKQIIRDNERWLANYCSLAKFTGWMLILLALFNFGWGAYSNYHYPGFHQDFLLDSMTESLVAATLIFLAANFIRYVLNPDAPIGFFLANGDKILYLTAALYFVGIVQRLHLYLNIRHLMPEGGAMYVASTMLGPSLLMSAAKVLITLGFAHGMHRIISIIQESKTLV